MIRFFKINDPFRIIALLFLIVAIRLPNIIMTGNQLIPELSWMLIGEKMSEGLTIYKDIDDNTGILSSYVYWLIHELVGKSSVTYQILSLLIVLLQAILFNFAISRLDLLKEKGYVPAFIYIIISSFYIDFYTLSPVLLSTTFVILAFIKFYQILKFGNSDNDIFQVGFYIGISTLLYVPSFLLFFLALFGFLFYTSTSIKNLFVLLYGFTFPLILIGVFYYWKGGLTNYLVDILYYSFGISKMVYIPTTSLVQIFLVPFLFLFISVMKTMNESGYINFQVKCMRLNISWLIIGLLTLLISHESSAFHLFLIIPPISYFIAAFFISFRRKILREFLTYSLIVIGVILGYAHHFDFLKSTSIMNESRLFVNKAEDVKTYGRVLNLGESIQIFANYKNQPATRYLDWNLSKRYFTNLNEMENVSAIYSNMKMDMPDAINDQLQIVDLLFNRIPEFKEEYTLDENGVYIRKNHSSTSSKDISSSQ